MEPQRYPRPRPCGYEDSGGLTSRGHLYKEEPHRGWDESPYSDHLRDYSPIRDQRQFTSHLEEESWKTFQRFQQFERLSVQPSSQYHGPRREANPPYEEMVYEDQKDDLSSQVQNSLHVEGQRRWDHPRTQKNCPQRPTSPQPMGVRRARELSPEGKASGVYSPPTWSKVVKQGVGRGHPLTPALGRGQVLQQSKSVPEAARPTPVVTQPQTSMSQSSRWFKDSEYSSDRNQFPTVEEATRGLPFNRSSFKGKGNKQGHSCDLSNSSGRVKKAPKRKFEGVKKGSPFEGSSLYLEADSRALQLYSLAGTKFPLRDYPERVMALKNSPGSCVILGPPVGQIFTLEPRPWSLQPQPKLSKISSHLQKRRRWRQSRRPLHWTKDPNLIKGYRPMY